MGREGAGWSGGGFCQNNDDAAFRYVNPCGSTADERFDPSAPVLGCCRASAVERARILQQAIVHDRIVPMLASAKTCAEGQNL